MPWFKFDDSFANDQRFLNLSLSARLLWVCARCHINHQMTDGVIPHAVISGFDIRKAKAAAKELIEAELWEAYGDDFVDSTWRDCIRSREDVERDREAARLRKERQRQGNASS